MGIIYKTTNTVNGKIYVGKSSFNDPKYLGSGVILNQAIKKYGIEMFKKEIIEECSNDVIDEREIFWIGELKTCQRGIGYNIALGGTGGDTTTHHPNKEEIIRKRSVKLIEWHQSMTDEEKNDHGKSISESKKGKSNGRGGSSHTPETIEKIRNNQPPKTKEWSQSHDAAMKIRKGTSMPKKYKRVRVDGVEYESVKHAIAGLGLKYAKYFHDLRRTGKIKVEYL